jgi:hypothetical protein
MQGSALQLSAIPAQYMEELVNAGNVMSVLQGFEDGSPPSGLIQQELPLAAQPERAGQAP